MQMLIIGIGDSHITGKSPVARLDNLVEVQFIKWKEVVQIANNYNCPVISTGDIFNVPVIANSILTQFGTILEDLRQPLYFVWGNHDLMYHSMDMYDRTSLGMLWHNNTKIRHISEFYKDYNIMWDYIDWGQPLVKGNLQLLLSHQAIIHHRMIGGKNSWILKDPEFARLMDKELEQYSIIICGHWHRRYNFKHKNTLIFNPGPLTRRTIEDKEEPQIQLINLETRLSKQIKLKSVKPTELVITDKHIEDKVHKSINDITDFINNLKSKKLKYTSSFIDNLMDLLDAHELESSVEKVLRSLIAKLIEQKGTQNQ